MLKEISNYNRTVIFDNKNFSPSKNKFFREKIYKRLMNGKIRN